MAPALQTPVGAVVINMDIIEASLGRVELTCLVGLGNNEGVGNVRVQTWSGFAPSSSLLTCPNVLEGDQENAAPQHRAGVHPQNDRHY